MGNKHPQTSYFRYDDTATTMHRPSKASGISLYGVYGCQNHMSKWEYDHLPVWGSINMNNSFPLILNTPRNHGLAKDLCIFGI